MESIDPNQWWGALAGVACGLGFRNLGVVIGYGGVAGVSVLVGACFIMLIDAAT